MKQFQMESPKITQLVVYPVKSLRGLQMREAELTERGLMYDRNWMVIDRSGKFVTQRSIPQMASLSVKLHPEQLIVTDENGDSVSVDFDTENKPVRQVEVWGDRCTAFDEGDKAANWLTERIHVNRKERYRLVRIHDEFRRQVDPEYLRNEDAHTAFADGFPFLITNEHSLEELNQKLSETGATPVTMDRFRPNIVIDGASPFLENEIDEFISPDDAYRLGVRKPCKRCKVTTVDQNTGVIKNPKEPLRTLTKMETVAGLKGAYFGMNSVLIKGSGETIRVGDELRFTT